MRKLLIVALLLLGSTSLFLAHQFSQPLNISNPEYLIVERGQGLSNLSEQLSSAGWLPLSSFLFRMYGRATASTGQIKAGEYAVLPGTTAAELLSLLRSGEVIHRTVTFPEGWTTTQWLKHLAKTPFLRVDDSEGLIDVTANLLSWEGRLYPDTYAYTRADSALDIIKRARQKMTSVLSELWDARSESAEVTSIEEALILASIIEKETGYGPDRPMIASVFNNRLARGMRLQSDPTVIYGLTDFDGDLLRSHLRVEHPFNTYFHHGLPAGPICNPGRSSIEAALKPLASPYLYFVAQGNGRSYFSTSLDEHNDAVNRYQKAGRVEKYRSSPSVEKTN